MNESSEWFNQVRRGKRPEQVARSKTKNEAFNAMLRALGTDQYEDAFKEYQAAQRREEQARGQHGEGSEGGDA